MLPSLKATYSSIKVEPDYPDGIEFVYVFVRPAPSGAAEYFKGQIPTLQNVFVTQVAPEMKAGGIVRPTATYTYRNPDGSLVWTHTFTRS